jgi:hypothetical protein
MAWPERFAVGVAILAGVTVIGYAACLVTVRSDDPPKHVIADVVLWLLYVVPLSAGFAWLVARVTDFVVGGPRRRYHEHQQGSK